METDAALAKKSSDEINERIRLKHESDEDLDWAPPSQPKSVPEAKSRGRPKRSRSRKGRSCKEKRDEDFD